MNETNQENVLYPLCQIPGKSVLQGMPHLMIDKNVTAMFIAYEMVIRLVKKPARNKHGTDLGWEALPFPKVYGKLTSKDRGRKSLKGNKRGEDDDYKDKPTWFYYYK